MFGRKSVLRSDRRKPHRVPSKHTDKLLFSRTADNTQGINTMSPGANGRPMRGGIRL
nr:MAG TPA: hypothetical protein [Microviridae sp.]